MLVTGYGKSLVEKTVFLSDAKNIVAILQVPTWGVVKIKECKVQVTPPQMRPSMSLSISQALPYPSQVHENFSYSPTNQIEKATRQRPLHGAAKSIVEPIASSSHFPGSGRVTRRAMNTFKRSRDCSAHSASSQSRRKGSPVMFCGERSGWPYPFGAGYVGASSWQSCQSLVRCIFLRVLE